jgi:hypothetical protein
MEGGGQHGKWVEIEGGGLSIASVGSRAGGNNRKRARSAQRRVGPMARPTASAPAPVSPLSVELSLVRALPPLNIYP